MIVTVLFIDLIFSILAAVMAFLITYEEYTHHFTGKKEPFLLGAETAIFTFIFFFIITMLAVLLLSRTI